MEAIREIIEVKNKKIEINLPENFDSKEVEVIVLPFNNNKKNSLEAKNNWQSDFQSVSIWEDFEDTKIETWKIQEF